MYEGKTRICLKCREKFVPVHRYNFLCRRCNYQNLTEYGKTIPLETRYKRKIRKAIEQNDY